MVDFGKLLASKEGEQSVDPISIYDTLDRASDKGGLRIAQEAILREWFTDRRDERDLLLKLHTGQGKTLIGLLILLSRLHEKKEPVLYLCPNKFLVNQTCEQARQFGIKCCVAEPDLPIEFIEGESILIVPVQKLFTGRTKFGRGPSAVNVDTILIDDAHTCTDSIRQAFQIRLSRKDRSNPYNAILDLFKESLSEQGPGTYAGIRGKKGTDFLPVPYWTWQDKQEEVLNVLAKYSDSNAVKFAWPLLKDCLFECQCFVSGSHIEISPYLPPLNEFGTYDRAKHRIFMSATITDDSFLVKGFGLEPETIRNPLAYKDEKWSGEKMILIPSLIDEGLDRQAVVKEFAKPRAGLKFGVVALAPSFDRTADWQAYGALVAEKKSIDGAIAALYKGDFEKPVVLVNRYDGIDLPDQTCRIFIFDSNPYATNLSDRYQKSCRISSEVTAIRVARTIEQGLGRSVRGERDYCVFILVGSDLVRTIRLSKMRQFFSSQTRTQVEIGLAIAKYAQEDMSDDSQPMSVLLDIVKKCIMRDPDWKAFYADKMKDVKLDATGGKVLDLFAEEFKAETKYLDGDIDGAVSTLQDLINSGTLDQLDNAWYLQEIARYLNIKSATESNKRQRAAHKRNRYLLKPRSGMQVSRLEIVSHKRVDNVIAWAKEFENTEELAIAVEDILDRLTFGVSADKFEAAFDELALALGLKGERPDKEWKQGPDNLWAIGEGKYWVVECKSEVKTSRKQIESDETEQMNKACTWFDREYKGATARYLIIIPTYKVAKNTAFLYPVEIFDKREWSRFRRVLRGFFNEFLSADLNDLSETRVQEWINNHGLASDDLMKEYGRKAQLLT